MTTRQISMVIGAFRDPALAQQALDELHQQGWNNDQARIIGRHSGGILTSLRGAFTERETAPEEDELAHLDLPDEQRQLYSRERAAGSSLVAVQAGEHQLEVRDLLNRYGAYNVYIPLGLGGERIIPLRREEAQVQKQVVEVGELRIHKRVITEQRTFTVPVTREEVTIERIPRASITQPYAQARPEDIPADARAASHSPVSTPINAAPGPGNTNRMGDPQAAGYSSTSAYQQPGDRQLAEALKGDGTLRILVHEEQVMIAKQAIVVEEIVVHKQIVEETRQLIEPIRHEELDIENIGNVPLHESRAETGVGEAVRPGRTIE